MEPTDPTGPQEGWVGLTPPAPLSQLTEVFLEPPGASSPGVHRAELGPSMQCGAHLTASCLLGLCFHIRRAAEARESSEGTYMCMHTHTPNVRTHAHRYT